MGNALNQAGKSVIKYKVESSSGEWCNGSTADSGSASLGSNPSSPAELSGGSQEPVGDLLWGIVLGVVFRSGFS